MKKLFFLPLILMALILINQNWAELKVRSRTFVKPKPTEVKKIGGGNLAIPAGEKEQYFVFWSLHNETSLALLQTLQQQINHGLLSVESLVAVNTDTETAELVPFLESHNFSFQVLQDPEKKIFTELGIQQVPSMYLYNKDGNIVWATQNFEKFLPENLNLFRAEKTKP